MDDVNNVQPGDRMKDIHPGDRMKNIHPGDRMKRRRDWATHLKQSGHCVRILPWEILDGLLQQSNQVNLDSKLVTSRVKHAKSF